jgi:hypothetical protein
MTFRRRLEHASRGRARPAFALVWWAVALVLLAASLVAQAEPVAGKIEEVDTEHMFGFTEGSEIGEKGETELLSETTGHFGKFGGSYSQIGSMIEAKYTLTDRFRVSGAATLAYYDVSGVPRMDDRRQASVQSISFSARYRLLDHQQSPFALTLSAEPRRGFVDEWSGAAADEIGAVFAALADRELIPDRVYGAFDLSYEPERTRLHGSPEISRQATFGVGAAVTALTTAGVFVGVDVRYFRQYDGLPLNNFAGQALYLGPTFYANLGPHALVSAAWETQVWGASGGSAGLDLIHFDRRQVMLRLAVMF